MTAMAIIQETTFEEKMMLLAWAALVVAGLINAGINTDRDIKSGKFRKDKFKDNNDDTRNRD